MILLNRLAFLTCLAVSLTSLCLKGQASAPAAHSQLEFSAAPIKERFAEGEKIMYEFKIRNRGPVTLLVSRAFILNYDIRVKVADDRGHEVPWCGVIVKYVFPKGQIVRLQGGKALSVRREISCDQSHDFGFAIVGPGDYAVTAAYDFPIPKEMRDHPGSVPVASGEYVSAPSRFKIVAKAQGAGTGAER